MTRHYIHKIKENANLGDFSVIILGAGTGTRINGECKPLLKIGSECIAKRQIRILKSKYGKNTDIIFVGGYKYAEVVSHIRGDCRILINERYNDTNVAYSMLLGLLATNKKNCLIVYGDLVFDFDSLPELSNKPFLLVDDHQFKKEEIGVIVQSNQIVNMLYEPKTKWCHIAYLTSDYSTALFNYCKASLHHKHFGYEAINDIINNVGPLNLVKCKSLISEVDTYKDLEEARTKFK
jgi:choline kinase